MVTNLNSMWNDCLVIMDAISGRYVGVGQTDIRLSGHFNFSIGDEKGDQDDEEKKKKKKADEGEEERRR